MGSWVDGDPHYTYWHLTRDIFMKLVPLAIKYDRDGIDIKFLNATDFGADNVTQTSRVQYLFSQVEPAGGGTPIGYELDGILRDYLREYEQNPRKLPLNLIVLTDGEPDDYDEVEGAIVYAASRIKELRARNRQIGIQFVQIGDDDAATDFLRKLDDELGAKQNVLDVSSQFRSSLLHRMMTFKL